MGRWLFEKGSLACTDCCAFVRGGIGSVGWLLGRQWHELYADKIADLLNRAVGQDWLKDSGSSYMPA